MQNKQKLKNLTSKVYINNNLTKKVKERKTNYEKDNGRKNKGKGKSKIKLDHRRWNNLEINKIKTPKNWMSYIRKTNTCWQDRIHKTRTCKYKMLLKLNKAKEILITR